MQAVERIRELLPALPIGDIPYGEKFLNKRDFESLREIVESAEYKVRKARSRDTSSYPEVDLDNLIKLKGEIRYYCAQLDLPEQESDFDWEEDL